MIAEEIPWLDPIAAFAPFAGTPHALLLDSSLADGAQGRHTYVAARPRHVLRARRGRATLDGRPVDGGGFAALAALLGPRRATDPRLPPFQGGAAGLFGYDLCHELERLPEAGPPPEARSDGPPLPDLAVGLYDTLAAFDLLDRRAWVLGPDAAAVARLRDALGTAPLDPPPRAPLDWHPEVDRATYEAAVRRVIEYIHAGDIFQANLSQRFTAALPPGFDAFDFYRRLRAQSPAPFAGYLHFGDQIVASSSPERFLRAWPDGRVETRPIKGTRPRGATPAEDAAQAEALCRSEKDRAENVMIVDLLRNDLSRVCLDHTVRATALCALESFATVHHLVSTVEGTLRPGLGPVDLLRAAFPGGSITGAPKVRAMEIIAELEQAPRGAYCGAMGWIGFDGAMDTNIVIRTATLAGGRGTFRVGGGIVADSDPAAEYEETLDKARAILRASS